MARFRISALRKNCRAVKVSRAEETAKDVTCYLPFLVPMVCVIRLVFVRDVPWRIIRAIFRGIPQTDDMRGNRAGFMEWADFQSGANGRVFRVKATQEQFDAIALCKDVTRIDKEENVNFGSGMSVPSVHGPRDYKREKAAQLEKRYRFHKTPDDTINEQEKPDEFTLAIQWYLERGDTIMVKDDISLVTMIENAQVQDSAKVRVIMDYWRKNGCADMGKMKRDTKVIVAPPVSPAK